MFVFLGVPFVILSGALLGCFGMFVDSGGCVMGARVMVRLCVSVASLPGHGEASVGLGGHGVIEELDCCNVNKGGGSGPPVTQPVRT